MWNGSVHQFLVCNFRAFQNRWIAKRFRFARVMFISFLMCSSSLTEKNQTSLIKLKLFNTLFNFLFEGNEKIAWNMNFVFIKAKIILSFLFFLALIETKFMFQAIFSSPSNRKFNKVLNNFSLIGEVTSSSQNSKFLDNKMFLFYCEPVM